MNNIVFLLEKIPYNISFSVIRRRNDSIKYVLRFLDKEQHAEIVRLFGKEFRHKKYAFNRLALIEHKLELLRFAISSYAEDLPF